MTDRDVELRFKEAVDSATPDILSQILLELPAQERPEEKGIDIDSLRPRKKKRFGRYFTTLAAALVLGEGMEDISFEKEKYLYLPYEKITRDNVEEYLDR